MQYIECTTLRMNLNANYGLWVIMMCQWGFINCNKRTSMLEDTDNEEDYSCVGTGATWKISVPSAHFCHEPETALKIKVS